MKEVWQKVIELYRYWNAGRKAVKEAHAIINDNPRYCDLFNELREMVEQYGITPTEELKDKILTIHNKLKAVDAQLGCRSGPNKMENEKNTLRFQYASTHIWKEENVPPGEKKNCEFDQMNYDGGDNHLCGSCTHVVNESVKLYVCKGCGKKHAPGVRWVWDDWCEDCEHKTFN